MSQAKTTIFLSRRITLERAGRDAVVMTAGRNEVDAEVAAHPFVKFHTIESVEPTDADTSALRARVAELENQLVDVLDRSARLEKQLLDKGGKPLAETRARVAELEKQLAQKDADMQALVDSMPK